MLMSQVQTGENLNKLSYMGIVSSFSCVTGQSLDTVFKMVSSQDESS